MDVVIGPVYGISYRSELGSSVSSNGDDSHEVACMAHCAMLQCSWTSPFSYHIIFKSICTV